MIKDGKLFGKLNLIDLVTILVVLLLIAGAILKFGVLQKDAQGAKETFQFTILVEGIRNFTIENLKVGDKLYDSVTKECIGTITAVESKPATVASTRADGSYVMATMDDRYDVTIHLETQGTRIAGRYYVTQKSEISANTFRSYYTKYASFSGTCMSVSAA